MRIFFSGPQAITNNLSNRYDIRKDVNGVQIRVQTLDRGCREVHRCKETSCRLGFVPAERDMQQDAAMRKPKDRHGRRSSELTLVTAADGCLSTFSSAFPQVCDCIINTFRRIS